MAIIASFENLPNVGDVVEKIEIEILSPGRLYEGGFYQGANYYTYVGNKRLWGSGEDLIIKSKEDKFPEGIYSKEQYQQLINSKK